MTDNYDRGGMYYPDEGPYVAPKPQVSLSNYSLTVPFEDRMVIGRPFVVDRSQYHGLEHWFLWAYHQTGSFQGVADLLSYPVELVEWLIGCPYRYDTCGCVVVDPTFVSLDPPE